MKHVVALTALLLAAFAANAGAQSSEPAGTPMKGMFIVYLLDRHGVETEGTLVSLTNSAAVVETGGSNRTFDLSDVARIYRKGDSLKNGALIGTGVGLVLGSLSGGLADCPGRDHDGHCLGSRVALSMVGVAVYAAIGTAIDALIPGRTLIWQAGARQTSARGLALDISPRTRRLFVGWRIR